jgi:hypothetical protein
MAEKSVYNVRCALGGDIAFLCDIDTNVKSYDYPISGSMFASFMASKNQCVMIVTEYDKPVGYYIYRVLSDRLFLLRLLVFPGNEAGSYVIERLRAKLTSARPLLVTTVSELNLAQLQLLRQCGWRAEALLRGCYGERDGILLCYRRRAEELIGADPLYC